MRGKTETRTAIVAAGCLLMGVTAGSAQRPEGYQQVVPRGAIASIDNPRYVPASEARIRNDAWVLGVEIDGEARAYSLDLLNAHEVVNDAIGGTAFAAVW